MSLKEFRELQRRKAMEFQQENPGIRNPFAHGFLDKEAPISSEEKALSLGFEAQGPKRWLDLPYGDAGSGQTMFRRSHVFYALDGPGNNQITSRIPFAPYSRAIGLATQRSSDQTPRYWHVSIYGTGVRRPGSLVGDEPLSEGDIDSRQFEAIYTALGAVETNITPPFVPSVPTCQARVLVHDESGGRYFDVDVLGTRSFNLYGFGVTVFLLIKENGYEVNTADEEQNRPIISDAGTEDDIVGARIVPIKTNATQNSSIRTITTTADRDLGDTYVPIPPGAKRVQVINHDGAAEAALWEINFAYNRVTAAARPDVGKIDMIPGLARSPVMEIPNAPAISFSAGPGTPATQWSLAFEVTA